MDIQSWMDLFLKELQNVFKNRLVFVGLQGSRGRGEGRPDSDIDVVVVLDRLTPADLDAYEGLLDRLPNRELVCGFVSGRQELARLGAVRAVPVCPGHPPLAGLSG